MEPIVCAFTVPFRYEILFTRGAFTPANKTLVGVLKAHRARRILVVIEEGLLAGNPELPEQVANYLGNSDIPFAVRTLPGGEKSKDADTIVRRFYDLMEGEKLCRHSCIAAIGGGAFLDVAGFAAATFHRGIKHVRFPSTLLSQADGGVGVKNGINFNGKKNLLGTFTPPIAVINDLNFLTTLPVEEMRAGLAEAVKVALIRDAAFFNWIESSATRLCAGKPVEIEILVRQCAALHVRHIAGGGDPFEQGSRRPLDFGHWSAHKLEQMSGFRLRHGEAVAIGMAVDSIYSWKSGHLKLPQVERIITLLRKLGLPLVCDELSQTGELLNGLAEFREHLGGELCITLLRGIGESFEVHTMDEARILTSIEELKAWPTTQAPEPKAAEPRRTLVRRK